MSYEYSEDNLIEQTAIELFSKQLGWDTEIAFNKEGFGEGSLLGRLNKKEVVLKKIVSTRPLSGIHFADVPVLCDFFFALQTKNFYTARQITPEKGQVCKG